MRSIKSMEKIAPNIFRASPKCLYIRIASGELKACSQDRYESLLWKHKSHKELVARYRVHAVTPKQKIAKLQTKIAELKRKAGTK